MTRPPLGSILTTEQEINALPSGTVVLADPEGRHRYDYHRQMPMKKLDYAYEDDVFWEPAHGEPITSSEAVLRYSLAPFLVLWFPPVEPVSEAAA